MWDSASMGGHRLFSHYSCCCYLCCVSVLHPTCAQLSWTLGVEIPLRDALAMQCVDAAVECSLMKMKTVCEEELGSLLPCNPSLAAAADTHAPGGHPLHWLLVRTILTPPAYSRHAHG